MSELSLGSWRTYERISYDAGIAVMRKAREVGINFLDDARYNDETGRAPMKTGYSEVVFGKLFRATGWKRDEVVLANKLWWEFWPEQSAAAELKESLGRMGIDYIDIAYAERLPTGMTVRDVITEIMPLIRAGNIRAWGVLNWAPATIQEAATIATEMGVPGPCAAQLPYSLVLRSVVEDPAMEQALDRGRSSIVASYTLAGGALTGKYDDPSATGRVREKIDERDYSGDLAVGTKLNELAREVGTRPAALAMAFALLNPRVTTALFGATSPEQIEVNLQAVDLKRTMDPSTIEHLRRIGA